MKVAVVAEFYPRRADPVLGVWAHRQALAVRHAGVDVHVLVLHRLVPPRRTLATGAGASLRSLATLLGEPRTQTHDGLPVTYVRYVSPPRQRSYHAWGTWAAPALALALRRLRRSFDFDLLHAHNAVPAGDALRLALAGVGVPLVVSVHGGDVLYTAPRSHAGERAVRRALGAAHTVLANSAGIAELARAYGAHDTRVVHLGATLPLSGGGPRPEAGGAPKREGGWAPKREADGAPMREALPEHGKAPAPGIAPQPRAAFTAASPNPPSLVTVGHLVARKRHADVLRTLAVLATRHPALRYAIVGDGPERAPLEALAERLGVTRRVDFEGQLPPEQALERMRRCTLLAMPSTEEAFGVAYVEAMAAGLPAIGCRGEPGPEEIAAAGGGMVLVPPGDIERLSQRIDELLSDPAHMRDTSRRARATVAAHFTWERCAQQTIAAYEHALR